MELIDYLRLLLKGWAWILSFTVAGVAAATLWIATSPQVYAASCDLFVGTMVNPRSATSPASAAQSSSQFALDRMQTYAALVTSPRVSTAVIKDLSLDSTPEELATQVSAAVSGKTVLVTVTARDESPARAADIANRAAVRLSETIEALETPPAKRATPLVNITPVRPATPPTHPVSPNGKLALVVGTLAGLGLGVLAAAARDQARRRPEGARRRLPEQSRQDVAAVLDRTFDVVDVDGVTTRVSTPPHGGPLVFPGDHPANRVPPR